MTLLLIELLLSFSVSSVATPAAADGDALGRIVNLIVFWRWKHNGHSTPET